MSTATIPKKLAKHNDVVTIPRKEYEALLEIKKIKEFFPTAAQKKALVGAEQRLRKGKTLSHKDSEGEYKESFVKKIRSRSQSQGPFQNFGSKESFLTHLRAKIRDVV